MGAGVGWDGMGGLSCSYSWVGGWDARTGGGGVGGGEGEGDTRGGVGK